MVPWQIDGAVLEEDVLNLAVAQPPSQRRLSIKGGRILARQVRDRVEAPQARAAALVGRSLAETQGQPQTASRFRRVCGCACPFDLHALLPVPDAVLQLGPNHPQASAWLQENGGAATLRQVVGRPEARPGRRLPRNHAVIGCGFFTMGDALDQKKELSPIQVSLGVAGRERPGDTQQTRDDPANAAWMRFEARHRPTARPKQGSIDRATSARRLDGHG